MTDDARQEPVAAEKPTREEIREEVILHAFLRAVQKTNGREIRKDNHAAYKNGIKAAFSAAAATAVPVAAAEVLEPKITDEHKAAREIIERLEPDHHNPPMWQRGYEDARQDAIAELTPPENTKE